MNYSLNNKVIILTGVCGGIGSVLLRKLLECQAKVIGVDLRVGQEVRDEFENVDFYECDLLKKEDFTKLVEKTINRYERITNLINAHGVAGNYALTEVTFEEFERVMNTNLYSVLMTCQVVIPYFVAQAGGNIINISSNLAFSCLPYNLPYTLSKSGINALTKTIAKEFISVGIKANAICPSVVATEMFIDYVKSEAAKENKSFANKKNELLSALPQKRWLMPEEIADLVIYLASDLADGITGQSIPINMGSYMF